MAKRPVPTHLKIVNGTERKDRKNREEPEPEKAAPPCPAHLSDEEKVAWGRYCQMLEEIGVLTVADGTALELLCITHCEVTDLTRQLREVGHTERVLSTQGEIVTKANPLVSMRDAARRELRLLLNEFGLTPAARTKVHTVSGNKTPQKQEPKRPASAYLD